VAALSNGNDPERGAEFADYKLAYLFIVGHRAYSLPSVFLLFNIAVVLAIF
jgi:hypothetical protein